MAFRKFTPMKHALKIFSTLFISLMTLQAFAGGIEFDHEITFQEALDKAKREGKLVFMDCYTSWCGPCKRLAATVFTDSAVGQYFNNNYVNVKFDMEKGEGTSIATRYQITAYPTLLWLDPNGSVKHKVVGGLDPQGLVNAGMKAANPISDALNAMDKQYSAGSRDQAFMEEYLKNFKTSGRNYDAVLLEYLSLAEKQKWSKESTLSTIFQMTNSYTSPGLEILKKDKAAFIAKVGSPSYTQKITTIAKEAQEEAIRKTNEKTLQQAIDLIRSNGGADSKQVIAKMEMDYYFNTANATVYDKYVSEYIKKYASSDAKLMNDVAWQYYINTNDEKYLKKARDWAFKAVNLKNTCANNTTYAYLQYKLHNMSEATKACDYAIIKSKEEKINPVSALALKEAIKKEAATPKSN
jgi:thiol-disulfide isomerase/thioredoxin